MSAVTNINIIIIYALSYKYCSYDVLFFPFLVISTCVKIITFQKLVVKGMALKWDINQK